MRPISQTHALKELQRLKDDLRSNVTTYEQRAQPCSTCDTPGECCLDEHFVNVSISRLEATAIANVIAELPAISRVAAEERINNVASELLKNNATTPTFPCPLYDKSTGCLVHSEAKPVPCLVHACYERREDLPPDDLQDTAEIAIAKLNHRVYRNSDLDPLPVAVQAILRTRKMNAITSPAKNQPAT